MMRHDLHATVGQRLDRGEAHRHDRLPWRCLLHRQVKRYGIDIDCFRVALHGPAPPPNIELQFVNIPC